jgi:hypothetical protein
MMEVFYDNLGLWAIYAAMLFALGWGLGRA